MRSAAGDDVAAALNAALDGVACRPPGAPGAVLATRLQGFMRFIDAGKLRLLLAPSLFFELPPQLQLQARAPARPLRTRSLNPASTTRGGRPAPPRSCSTSCSARWSCAC